MGELNPRDEADLADCIIKAASEKEPLEIVGGGSKRALGRPVLAKKTLSIAHHNGISLYEPGALTIVAKSGTPLSEVEAALARENQRLSFEPMDYRPLLGEASEPTIGGTVATNTSGPRRIQSGACRDSLIGVRFVNGEGEIIKNGGRVMKNVTGLDLVKLMCGSYGTLGVLSEVSFKVLPMNEREATLLIHGQTIETAVKKLAQALGSPFEVTGAAIVAEAAGTTAALRVEGFSGQVDYKLGNLAELLGGDSTVLESVAHKAFWARVRNVEDFAGHDTPVWKISVKPSDAPRVIAEVRSKMDANVMLDWGGGLIWLELPESSTAHPKKIREIISAFGGHATLIRASEEIRSSTSVFHPEAARLAALSRDLRSKFDPFGILNPGRMVAEGEFHAN